MKKILQNESSHKPFVSYLMLARCFKLPLSKVTTENCKEQHKEIELIRFQVLLTALMF